MKQNVLDRKSKIIGWDQHIDGHKDNNYWYVNNTERLYNHQKQGDSIIKNIFEKKGDINRTLI